MCQLRRGTTSSPTTRLVTCTALAVSSVSAVGAGQCYRVVGELCSGQAEQSAGRAEGEAVEPTGGQAPGLLQLQAQDRRRPRAQAVSNLHRPHLKSKQQTKQSVDNRTRTRECPLYWPSSSSCWIPVSSNLARTPPAAATIPCTRPHSPSHPILIRSTRVLSDAVSCPPCDRTCPACPPRGKSPQAPHLCQSIRPSTCNQMVL